MSVYRQIQNLTVKFYKKYDMQHLNAFASKYRLIIIYILNKLNKQ